MKINLTGEQAAGCVLALAGVSANRSFNTLRALLDLFGISELADGAIEKISKTKSVDVELPESGNTSWQVVLDSLSELPLKQVAQLYSTISGALQKGT